MLKDSLSKHLGLMEHQVESQERLSEFLAQAIAMLKVALHEDFSAFDQSTIYYYLSAIDDIVVRARNFNEHLSNNWTWIIKLLSSHEPPAGGTRH